MNVDEDLIVKHLEASEIDYAGTRHRLYRHPAQAVRFPERLPGTDREHI
jgi:hypothetical protein